jgi:hypothetical protein
MITNFELTDQGTAKFNAWFSATARSNIDLTAVTLEALRSFEDGVAEGTSPHYELRGQYTNSGNPSVIFLDEGDFTMTEEADEE